MRVFGRKKVENKPLCFHLWRLIDYASITEVSDLSTTHYFTVGCKKCGDVKKVDEYGYYNLKRLGLLQEVSE